MPANRTKCDRCKKYKYMHQLTTYKQKDLCKDCLAILSKKPIKLKTDDEYKIALRKHLGVHNG